MNYKTITLYELLGLIKNGEAPKKIIYDEKPFQFDESDEVYYSSYGEYNEEFAEFFNIYENLNDTIKIPDDTEFIDIDEELVKKFKSFDSNANVLGDLLYKVIKNQKTIIQKLRKEKED